MKARQTRFADSEFRIEDKFGGSLSKRRRYRKARPVSTKETMHLILKSSVAKGAFSFRAAKNCDRVDTIIKSNCAKFGVRLVKYSNNFNHLHLQVKFGSRALYKRFVRAISGHIAMAVTGAGKSKPIRAIIQCKNFWDFRPFSRVARGWRGFKIVNDYVRLNQLEAEGVIEKRDQRLRGVKPAERKYFVESGLRAPEEPETQLKFTSCNR